MAKAALALLLYIFRRRSETDCVKIDSFTTCSDHGNLTGLHRQKFIERFIEWLEELRCICDGLYTAKENLRISHNCARSRNTSLIPNREPLQ